MNYRGLYCSYTLVVMAAYKEPRVIMRCNTCMQWLARRVLRAFGPKMGPNMAPDAPTARV